jgi:hypothetical protein
VSVVAGEVKLEGALDRMQHILAYLRVLEAGLEGVQWLGRMDVTRLAITSQSIHKQTNVH